MKKSGHSTIFGRRSEPHTIIIARGDEIRHFTVRPWLAAFAGSALAAMAVGYLLATSYLVLRDDLIGATVARQARMQHSYEDRISALRAQVDRITSRQLLDQNLMETKVSELLSRQSKLTERHGRLDPIMRRAEEEAKTGSVPAATGDDKRADATLPIEEGIDPLAYAGTKTGSPFALWSTREGSDTAMSQADRADKLFVAINQSLRSIESEQMDRVETLADNAYQKAETISDTLQAAGLSIDADVSRDAMGGPFIAANPAPFDAKVEELDQALTMLDTVRQQAKALPISNPAPDRSISSTFGIRKDPLLGTPAMHSGMDFRAPIGYPTRATAPGVVVKAGWNGGYGRMVEIDHGDGFSTRFAHLSRIEVVEGQKVVAGQEVGKVGSSGRSTGPHLHYEVRKNGTALDPLRFIKVGKKLSQFL